MAKTMVTLPVCKMGRESNRWEVKNVAFPVNRIKMIEDLHEDSLGVDYDEPKSELHFLDDEITYWLLVDAATAEQKINGEEV